MYKYIYIYIYIYLGLISRPERLCVRESVFLSSFISSNSHHNSRAQSRETGPFYLYVLTPNSRIVRRRPDRMSKSTLFAVEKKHLRFDRLCFVFIIFVLHSPQTAESCDGDPTERPNADPIGSSGCRSIYVVSICVLIYIHVYRPIDR